MKRAIAVFCLLVLFAGVSALVLRPRSRGQVAAHRELHVALAGHEPASSGYVDLQIKTGGLREYVVEIFFRPDPRELAAMLAGAPFQSDPGAVRAFRGGNHHFAALSQMTSPDALLGFARADLNPQTGKYCFVITDQSYSFAYVTYVET